MARLPRLAIGGLPHLVVQRGHNGQPVFVDDEDRRRFIDALREAMAGQQVAVHAWALLDHEVWLVLTPPEAAALSRAMQSLGRRYVTGFNARHGRSGTLWDGRFRATVLQPEVWLLPAMCFVDGLATPWSSAPHHLGQRRDPLVSNAGAYWELGNTPFDRELAWRRLLDDGLSAAQLRQIDEAARKGWALGDAAWVSARAPELARPLTPRRRGRPPRAA